MSGKVIGTSVRGINLRFKIGGSQKGQKVSRKH